MNFLQQLLGEVPLEEFLHKHFTRIPFSSTSGANNFTSLLTWDVVKEVLTAKKSVLRIVHDGRVIKDYVEMNFEEAMSHHNKGHTLLLRYAEQSNTALHNLAQDFAKFFHTEVDIQLYCSPERQNAFGWHYDIEEVFVIQTKGSKHFTIRPNTIHPNPLLSSAPKDQGYEKEKTPIEIKVTLKEGDWLYIPSGWWHVAQTREESMHISLGLMPNSALDILHFAPKYMASNAFWRTRMPVHKNFENEDEEVAFYQEAMMTLGKDLVKHLSSPEFIKVFLKQKKSK